MTKPQDKDLLALKHAAKALKRSTSRRMLKANLDFLMDHFLFHPSQELPEHLQRGVPCSSSSAG